MNKTWRKYEENKPESFSNSFGTTVVQLALPGVDMIITREKYKETKIEFVEHSPHRYMVVKLDKQQNGKY